MNTSTVELIEKCLKKTTNKFMLTLLVAQRVRNIIHDSQVSVSNIGNKFTIMAFEDIANNEVNIEDLEVGLMQHYYGNNEIKTQSKYKNEELIDDEISEEALIVDLGIEKKDN